MTYETLNQGIWSWSTHRAAVTNITVTESPFKKQIKIINTQPDKKERERKREG